MGWLSDNRLWLLFAAVVLTTMGAVGVAIIGVVATLSTLVTGGSLVATVGAFLLGFLALVGLDLLWSFLFLKTLAQRASLPTNQRAADVFHRVESTVPPLSALGLGDRFEPSVEDRRAALTERYVADEITEAELEAELRELLAEESDQTPPVETVTDRIERSDAADPASENVEREPENVERET